MRQTVQTRRRMGTRGGRIVLSLAALCLLPFAAGAQGTDANAKATSGPATGDTLVSVNVDDVSLMGTIKQMMNSVHADYTIDGSLRGAKVTAHLNDVRLSVALSVLLKSSSVPATFSEDHGIFSITPRTEKPSIMVQHTGKKEAEPVPQTPRTEKISVNFVDAGALARLLGGNPFYIGGQSFGFFDSSSTHWGESGAPGSSSSNFFGFGLGGGSNVLLGNAGTSGGGRKP